MPRELFLKFSQLLLKWYDRNGRKTLPWREDISPYRVWVSEIMLQQTQVKTVIPYFLHFIQHFPSVDDLANAHEDEVLHFWTGLGYYSRARNLHQAAKIIQAKYQSLIPNQLETLMSLPGIGRSTAGAILSIAFNQATPILDGNVKRILTRFHAIEGSPELSVVNQQLWHWAQVYTPMKRATDYTQAIMDLGALICTRSNPLCSACPLQDHCQAHQQQRETAFPSPKKRKEIPLRHVHMLIFHDPISNRVLLEKRPPVGVWGGLWSFPECLDPQILLQWSEQRYGLQISQIQQLPIIMHKFSHFQLNITPLYIKVLSKLSGIRDSERQTWYHLEKSSPRGLPAPVKRLLAELTEILPKKGVLAEIPPLKKGG